MAVLELSVFSDFTYNSDLSSKDCCTETKNSSDLNLVHKLMKHWPTWRCAECLNVHCSLGEMASDIGAHPILGELLYHKGFHHGKISTGGSEW